MSQHSALFQFPNPVNETASRTVAAGVAVVAALAISLQLPWISAVLGYGFLARVATGPTLSPLGQVATRWVAPRLTRSPRLVPGPPKRFAQGIGATLTVVATGCWFGLHAAIATYVLLALLVVAATLEAGFAICIGCWVFGRLSSLGVVPPTVCEACTDVSRRGAEEAAIAQARPGEPL